MKELKLYSTAGVLLIYLLLAIASPASGEGGISGPGSGVQGPGPNPPSPDDHHPIPQITVEKILKAVQDGKTQKPAVYEDLRKLLHIDILKPINYIAPYVWVYDDNKYRNVSREDRINISALVRNDNNLELRRTIILTLEIKEPGEKDFKPFNTEPQKIFMNEYGEQYNTSERTFPELTSFRYLKKVGNVTIRIKAEDGLATYYSSDSGYHAYKGYYLRPELVFNVHNVPPQINNSTMSVTPSATWDGFIEYRASLNRTERNLVSSGKEQNTINATLYIYNDSNGREKFHISKDFPEGDDIYFSTKDASFFTDKDAGKNFTYRFSVCDGILSGTNTTWSENGTGPCLKKSAKIIVMVPQPNGKDAEDTSNDWWHKYKFTVMVKSKDPEVKNVQMTLRTDTPSHPGHVVDSPNNPQTRSVTTNNYTIFEFTDMKPFDVRDCNQTYKYYFEYDTEDEKSNRQTDPEVGGTINARVLYYSFDSFEGIGNLLLLLLVSLAIGILIELSVFRRGGV